MKKQPKWFKGDVQFNVGNKLIKFSIIHDIPHSGDINGFNGAVQNWLMRTDEYTPENFVDYINSKYIHQAYTEEQFKEKFLNENPRYRPSATRK